MVRCYKEFGKFCKLLLRFQAILNREGLVSVPWGYTALYRSHTVRWLVVVAEMDELLTRYTTYITAIDEFCSGLRINCIASEVKII